MLARVYYRITKLANDNTHVSFHSKIQPDDIIVLKPVRIDFDISYRLHLKENNKTRKVNGTNFNYFIQYFRKRQINCGPFSLIKDQKLGTVFD